jgi:serine/threonine-protein kinase
MLDKMFAIKILSPNEITSDSSSERFQREAHAAASLSHPNIITVYDFGVLPEGTLYLAMEFLDGETLSSVLEKEGNLEFKQAIPIFIQVCLALEYAHTQGVIHRDLKPSNIMLIKDYKSEIQLKVIDFSIAKFTRPKANQKTITKPGEIFGTPLYMSPEQCQGKKPDHRSDIYSLGCVLYETLSGSPPLLGDSMLTTIYRHVNDLPDPFSKKLSDSSIPAELEAIVFKSLAKLADDRYQSAAELRAALESFMQGRKTKQLQFKPNIKLSYQFACLKNALWVILLFVVACFAIAFCLFLDANVTH